MLNGRSQWSGVKVWGLEEELQIISADRNYDLQYISSMRINGKSYWVWLWLRITVSNNNYLAVTAHIIDDDWKLQSFALSVQIISRHFGDACTKDWNGIIFMYMEWLTNWNLGKSTFITYVCYKRDICSVWFVIQDVWKMGAIEVNHFFGIFF